MPLLQDMVRPMEKGRLQLGTGNKVGNFQSIFGLFHSKKVRKLTENCQIDSGYCSGMGYLVNGLLLDQVHHERYPRAARP